MTEWIELRCCHSKSFQLHSEVREYIQGANMAHSWDLMFKMHCSASSRKKVSWKALMSCHRRLCVGWKMVFFAYCSELHLYIHSSLHIFERIRTFIIEQWVKPGIFVPKVLLQLPTDTWTDYRPPLHHLSFYQHSVSVRELRTLIVRSFELHNIPGSLLA